LKYFFQRGHPPFTKVLLIESGSRRLFDGLIPGLLAMYGPQLQIDLVTCFAGAPEGFKGPEGLIGEVFRVTDYTGRAGRKRLYAELAERNYPIAGIICSGEAIMTKWKWVLALRLPAKLFVLNENADYFWFDWAHWRIMSHFVLYRAGLTGAAAIPTIARLLFFPASLSYLLLYAAAVHLRRRLRLL
jgi:hypothetical protein